MAILPNGSTTTFKESSGGSPRGWSFIGVGLDCWRRWFLQYVFGLYPVKKAEALELGAAFHLFMEGKTTEEVARAFPEHAVEAKRLAEVRLKGPPLPKATSVEEEFVIFGGYMTSKPDRIEVRDGKRVVRDFKTSAFFSDKDEESWNVDGGILGECVAGETDEAIVDITSKRERKEGSTSSGPDVKVVTARLTPKKRAALERLVKQWWREAERRVTQLAEELSSAPVERHGELFDDYATQNLRNCVGKYGVCPYYARCWGKPPESMLYRLTEEPPKRWATMKQGPQPMKWKWGKKVALDVIIKTLRGKV